MFGNVKTKNGWIKFIARNGPIMGLPMPNSVPSQNPMSCPLRMNTASVIPPRKRPKK